jgi:hypothetical protein
MLVIGCATQPCSVAGLYDSEQHTRTPRANAQHGAADHAHAGVGIDWTFASLDEAAANTVYGFAGRGVAVLVSLGGVCVTALLLGIVSEQISHWIEDLKRGRSEVGIQTPRPHLTQNLHDLELIRRPGTFNRFRNMAVPSLHRGRAALAPLNVTKASAAGMQQCCMQVLETGHTLILGWSNKVICVS